MLEMVRRLALVLFVVGCAAEPSPSHTSVIEVDAVISGKADRMDEPGVCELASALPPDDVCSTICDPGGSKAGAGIRTWTRARDNECSISGRRP